MSSETVGFGWGGRSGEFVIKDWSTGDPIWDIGQFVWDSDISVGCGKVVGTVHRERKTLASGVRIARFTYAIETT